MTKHTTQKQKKKKKIKKQVRGELDRLLGQFEDQVSDQLDVILSGAREDAAETAVAIRGLHTMVQSDMNAALLEVSNGCVLLREGLAQFDEARSEAETAAHECNSACGSGSSRPIGTAMRSRPTSTPRPRNFAPTRSREDALEGSATRGR